MNSSTECYYSPQQQADFHSQYHQPNYHSEFNQEAYQNHQNFNHEAFKKLQEPPIMSQNRQDAPQNHSNMAQNRQESFQNHQNFNQDAPQNHSATFQNHRDTPQNHSENFQQLTPHQPAFCATPSVSNWQQQVDSGPQRCRICGDSTRNKHFGVECCSACAAFFRRTVAYAKSYVCTREKDCCIRADEPRHQCRFCRFQKCVIMGMCISAVTIQPRPEEHGSFMDNPLQLLLHCRRGMYVNRYRSTLKAYAGQHKLIKFGKSDPNFLHTTLATHAEYAVLREYLRSSGFPEMDIDGVKLDMLAQSFFYNWVCFTSAANTCRNNGQETNHAYFVDDSHVRINEDALERYHKTCWLSDPALVARVSFDVLKDAVNAAIKFHKARLDEVEMTVICHLMALRKAATLFPDNVYIQSSINALFESLREHYEENYEDTPIRMGNLILLINEVEYVNRNFNQYVVILNLNGYDTVLEKIKERQKKTESSANTPRLELSVRSVSPPPANSLAF